ncbi:transposase [Actinokineospora sp. G85]|uniref:transposase n=1 Tax=Actinokineospora sp. G85 TaxID=3406626 RepID=UPI003C78998A
MTAPLLPAQSGRRGGRWRSHRRVIDAILWKERTGAPWRDLPERYGPGRPAHERPRKWTADGTWDRVLEHVIVKDDSLGTPRDNVAFVVSVDSTSVRAHQHADIGDATRAAYHRAEIILAYIVLHLR